MAIKKTMTEANPLWEAVKLPLRMIVLAIIPFAIAYLTEINYEWAGAVTTLLVFLDKYLHEIWSITREEGKPKGLVPF